MITPAKIMLSSAQRAEPARSRGTDENTPCDSGAFRQVSVVWPQAGGTPYLHLCDEEHGHRLLSPADLDDLAAQTEPLDATHLHEALQVLSRITEQIERVNA